MIELAKNESPFLDVGELDEPTYFCQSAAVCHFIASNYMELRNETGTLNSEELGLVRQIAKIMQPDNDGRLWAKDVAPAAARLLKCLEAPQEPRFLPPKVGASYMALLRVEGPSRREKLRALYDRMDCYAHVSDASKKLVRDQIKEMVSTRFSDRSSRMKLLEGDILDVPEGDEHLVVEAILKKGTAIETAAEIEAAKNELEREFEAELTAGKRDRSELVRSHEVEISELKSNHLVSIDEMKDTVRDLVRKNDQLRRRASILWTLLVAGGVSATFFIVSQIGNH